MSEKQYRSFHGVVQFDPREGQAGGKDVRNITIRATGVKEQSMRVGATLWPSHGHVDVEKGSVVTVEGVFTRSKGTNTKTGEDITYNNLSVTSILVHGVADDGREVETVNDTTDDDAGDDDDIPY